MNKISRVSHALIGPAILTVSIIFLQMLGGLVSFGLYSVSLALVPIVLGAALYGPAIGAWLGFVYGMVVVLSGDTSEFMRINMFATVFFALLKGILAGYAAGMVFKLISRRSIVLAAVLAAIAGPLVNTSVLLIGILLFFIPTISEWARILGYESVKSYLILNLTGANFLLELILCLLLSPLILLMLQIRMQRRQETCH